MNLETEIYQILKSHKLSLKKREEVIVNLLSFIKKRDDQLILLNSSLQLNERLKTSFEDYKNKHFIEMENYYLNRYNAEHLSLEQIIDKYIDD